MVRIIPLIISVNIIDLIDVEKCNRTREIFAVCFDIDAMRPRQEIDAPLDVPNTHAATDMLLGRVGPYFPKQEHNTRLLHMILKCIKPKQPKNVFAIGSDKRQTRSVNADLR